ncbi:MAG TPA: ABC transporter permease [Anaerolineales bacterium]
MSLLRRIGTLIAKDIRLYYLNRFFAFITVMSLVFFLAAYFLLPRQQEDTTRLGYVGPALPALFEQESGGDGVFFVSFDETSALRQAILDGDIAAGVRIPSDMVERLEAGERPAVDLYASGSIPTEFRQIYALVVEELVFAWTGDTLSFEVEEEILGPDMAGQQVAPRNRMLPLLSVLILMMETLGLASLITTELTWGTLRALLVTRVGFGTLFVSKGVTGVSLAFVQAALLLAVTGGLATEPLLLISFLLAGSLLVTGIAFLVSSVSKDMLSVTGLGGLVLILLAIPGLTVLLPGLTSGWIRLIPSYYLVEPMYRVINLGASWSQVGSQLLTLVAYAAVIVAAGVWTLRRRFS